MSDERRGVVAIGALVLGVVACFAWQAWALHGRGEALRAELAGLDTEVAGLELKVARTPGLRTELHEVEGTLGEMIRILPSPELASEEHLLELVGERLERAGGRIERVRIARPGR